MQKHFPITPCIAGDDGNCDLHPGLTRIMLVVLIVFMKPKWSTQKRSILQPVDSLLVPREGVCMHARKCHGKYKCHGNWALIMREMD